MRLTIIEKYTTGGVNSANVSTDIGFNEGNRMSFDSEGNDVGFDVELCISSDNNNVMGFNTKVDVGDNPGEKVVCLDVLSVIAATSLASSQFNAVAATSSIASCGHFVPIFSMDRIIKPLVLFSQAQPISYTVFVSSIVRFFDNI